MEREREREREGGISPNGNNNMMNVSIEIHGFVVLCFVRSMF